MGLEQAARRALEALESCALVFTESDDIDEAINALREALAEQAEQEPVAWYDKIKGMEVSVDVSTGEDDIHHRIFGRVDGVMLQSCGAQEDTILVIEDSRNFAATVRTKDLTDDEIEDAVGWTMTEQSILDCRAVIAADRKLNGVEK